MRVILRVIRATDPDLWLLLAAIATATALTPLAVVVLWLTGWLS